MLKPMSAFKLVGKDVARVDLPSKVNGSAVYGIDTRMAAAPGEKVRRRTNTVVVLVGERPEKGNQSADYALRRTCHARELRATPSQISWIPSNTPSSQTAVVVRLARR